LFSSLLIHGLVLGWVAWGPERGSEEKPRSLYDQVIAPHEKQLVWFSFRDKLPDVSPLERHGISQPPEARVKVPQQQIVSRARTGRTPQMIWTPAPVLDQPRDLPLPNLMAFETPQAPAPPVKPPPAKPKLFVPPPEAPRPAAEIAALAPAPQIAPQSLPQQTLLPQKMAQPVREFVAPREHREAAASPRLPAAPEIALAGAGGVENPLRAAMARPVREFITPVDHRQPVADPKLPLPPEPAGRAAGGGESSPVNGTLPEAVVGGMARPVRQFVPPRQHASSARGSGGSATLAEPPPLASPESASGRGSRNLRLAVVGLNPAEKLEAPLPENSRPARFSAADKVRSKGGDGEPVETARIFVPDLMVRGGGTPAAQPVLVARQAPTSQASLQAALRSAKSGIPPLDAPPVIDHEPPPDPSLLGRVVYRLAIQMPNVSSYSGSWTMWFAERDAISGPGMRLPEPLRKVDPKYYASAMRDRVEGRVRLRAIIEKNGHVADVAIVQKLDERLDQSAAEALRKWEFTPAARGGVPIAMDMVVEIPFRLKPESQKTPR
jgi:TonB family protein